MKIRSLDFSFVARASAATLLFTLAFASSSARASSITWDTPGDISGDSDVSTNGTLINAFTVGDTGVTSATVNGVNFQSFAAPGGNGTVGDFTLASSLSFANNTGFGSADSPFASLSASYQTILYSGIAGLGDFTLTMSGLVVGKQYQVQFWVNNSSDSNNYQPTITGGLNSVNVGSNGDHMNGGLGQFVIGSFTADSASQLFTFTPDEVAFLNAFQLREVNGAQSVPDSGKSAALLGLGLAGLLLFRQRLGDTRLG